MSTHIKKLLGHRFLLAIGLLLSMVAFSLVLVQPPKAGACPVDTVEVTYYTDASMTEICGRAFLTCYCSSRHWGCQTAYSTERYLLCE